MGKVKKEARKPAKQARLMSEIFQHYHQSGKANQLRPEGFLEISRIFGPAASIDMNRLVCQHQQNVASAYMRRIRRDKVRQQDLHFQNLKDIPMKIQRVAVGPGYVDPYSDFKSRLPKLGQDKQFTKKSYRLSPALPPADMASPYVPHNSLSPHTNVLFKMNPGSKETSAVAQHGKAGNSSKTVEDDLPFPLSPRKLRFPPKLGGGYELPAIRKRLAVDATRPDPVGIRGSVDISPRGPSNSPRNAAFWSFNIPRELNTGEKRCHVASIPRGKDALAAISSVQKHNKPGSSSAMPILPPIPAIATKA
ncbi:hypothetical protein ElyMa_001118000 [Elysia marginata]|uniref:Uncharacterized protein n=1 Tax=Elysia marginata TaxID=1093978 RepID=A0AAV4HYF5_9GAST|nr:hypothetical protein ElyMa_001118000 [Elysia marginata]